MSAEAATPAWQLERHGSDALLRLTGDWLIRDTELQSVKPHDVLAQAEGAGRLMIDTGGLGRWDSAIIVFVQALREAANPRTGGSSGTEIDESGLPDAVRRLLGLAAGDPQQTDTAGRPAKSLPERVGGRAISGWDWVVSVASLVGETALRGGAVVSGRGRARLVDVLQMMREAGANALLIVTVVNALIGGIMAFVGAIQLRRFAADSYAPDLVGISVVREMAAVMTAIVMAGRTGGAYAAQIATMEGNEEIDALKAFGIPVFDYLVLPRIIALVAMMPLLYIYACAIGLLGGLVVGVSVLNVSTIGYLDETRRALVWSQFALGLSKSVVFGALIALVSCQIGLGAGRSSADVGKAATSAVVASIIGIIAMDAVFAVCANALMI